MLTFRSTTEGTPLWHGNTDTRSALSSVRKAQQGRLFPSLSSVSPGAAAASPPTSSPGATEGQAQASADRVAAAVAALALEARAAVRPGGDARGELHRRSTAAASRRERARREARRRRRQAGPHALAHLVLGRQGLAEAALEAAPERAARKRLVAVTLELQAEHTRASDRHTADIMHQEVAHKVKTT